MAGSGVPWGHDSCTGDQNHLLELLFLQTRLSGGRESCGSAVVTVEAPDAKGLCWWSQCRGESFSDIQGAEPGDADCSGQKERKEKLEITLDVLAGSEAVSWLGKRRMRVNSINNLKPV